MQTVWKVLVGLALVVPMGAYVAGSLAASASDDPAPRQTIQIEEPAPTRTPPPSRTPSPSPSRVEVITPYDDLDDDHGDDRGDGRGDDDQHDDQHGDRHGGDDHSGHGGRGKD